MSAVQGVAPPCRGGRAVVGIISGGNAASSAAAAEEGAEVIFGAMRGRRTGGRGRSSQRRGMRTRVMRQRQRRSDRGRRRSCGEVTPTSIPDWMLRRRPRRWRQQRRRRRGHIAPDICHRWGRGPSVQGRVWAATRPILPLQVGIFPLQARVFDRRGRSSLRLSPPPSFLLPPPPLHHIRERDLAWQGLAGPRHQVTSPPPHSPSALPAACFCRVGISSSWPRSKR